MGKKDKFWITKDAAGYDIYVNEKPCFMVGAWSLKIDEDRLVCSVGKESIILLMGEGVRKLLPRLNRCVEIIRTTHDDGKVLFERAK